MSKMRLIIEGWRGFLSEMSFADSTDEDSPGKNQLIVFSQEEKYDIAGKTHGALSHTIKHFKEFEPDKMKAALDSALSAASSFDNYFLINIKSGEVIASGDAAKKNANQNAMLNTFDMINDKIKNKASLLPEEEKIIKILDPLNKEYQNIADHYISSAVDIENLKDPNKIKQLLDAGKVVKFIGEYSGLVFDYYLDPSTTGMVPIKDDKIITIYRLDKSGNNLGKVAKYFSRGVKLKNPALISALKSYVGAPPEQQKKKEKPQPSQKKKTSPGDIVRRLRQANKPDDQIRQILSKAFPKLPEKAIVNMLTNIKE